MELETLNLAQWRADRDEEAYLNCECSRLFASDVIYNPAKNLAAAILVCKRIAEIVEANPTTERPLVHISYICLAQSQVGAWAASFHLHAFDNPDWYEAVEIDALPYSARAATPELAIARAAAKCVPYLLPLLET